MTITPLAKSYFKTLASHTHETLEDVWLPIISWDGLRIHIATECPWRVAAGTPALPPMFIKVDLGFKMVPYLLIDPDSEQFFRNAHIDLNKDRQLVVTHKEMF